MRRRYNWPSRSWRHSVSPLKAPERRGRLFSPNARLALRGPKVTGPVHIGAITLLRHQPFFYMSSPPG